MNDPESPVSSPSSESESRDDGQPDRRNNRKPMHPLLTAGLGAAGALAVAVVTLYVQGDQAATQQRREFKQETRLKLSDLRRPVYQRFLNRADDWSTAQTQRAAECKPGTNEPRRRDKPCTIGYLTDLQHTRYLLRGAENEMSTVESKRGRAARVLVQSTLPNAAVYEPGPAEALPDSYFGDAYVLFLDQMTCDTNPEPPLDCHETWSKIGTAVYRHLR